MGSDLPHDKLDEAARIVCRDVSTSKIDFRIYRTILWTPSDHADLFKRIKDRRPDIEIVDANTMMMLAKYYAASRK